MIAQTRASVCSGSQRAVVRCRGQCKSRLESIQWRILLHQAHQRRASVRCFAASPADSSRRQVLSVGAAVAAAALSQQQAVAQQAPACDLVTAPNGIQYCEEQEGTGKAAVSGTNIRCHYTGRLASNNAVFDSSYDRGRPLSFTIGVGQVIQGWDQGILGTEGIPPMKEGGKRRLVIPSELGYGARGAGRGLIPPNATLIFDVELLPPYSRK